MLGVVGARGEFFPAKLRHRPPPAPESTRSLSCLVALRARFFHDNPKTARPASSSCAPTSLFFALQDLALCPAHGAAVRHDAHALSAPHRRTGHDAFPQSTLRSHGRGTSLNLIGPREPPSRTARGTWRGKAVDGCLRLVSVINSLRPLPPPKSVRKTNKTLPKPSLKVPLPKPTQGPSATCVVRGRFEPRPDPC